MTGLLARLLFALRRKTLARAVVDPEDPERLLVCAGGREMSLKRRCHHQGAPLETGYFDGDVLVCPWHGCRFPLGGRPGA